MGWETFTEGARVRAGEVVQAEFQKDAFNCVSCAAFAKHTWIPLASYAPISQASCERCNARSYWIDLGTGGARMLYPATSTAPPPHVDTPANVLEDYREAASIVERSPRGAGALLRLGLQELMPHLGESGKRIDDDIKSLVAKGLAPEVQQALDALRVVGNNAVHPLELDLRDDRETVGALFGLMNYIVEERISRPKRLAAIYGALPEGARAAIERRDQPALEAGDET